LQTYDFVYTGKIVSKLSMYIKTTHYKGAAMNLSEAEQAWRLWHLLQELSNSIWEHYESAFLDFSSEDQPIITSTDNDNELPF
jgi:hypothetical protein